MGRTTFNGVLHGAFAVNSHSAFEAVLTDIPLFCAGLAGLASVTFVFLIKRVNSSTLYLGVGALLLLIAAILDLGQLLDSQSSPADKDSVDASGLVVAREVGLGLAFGFVLLFVWNTIVQRRRDLKRPTSVNAQRLPHDAGRGRWLKFWISGLRWFALALVISIALLQVSWRIIPSQRQYGGLYIAESILEIVTSVILIIAIVLNVLLELPASRRWLSLRTYLGLILALLTTVAIGIGNLVVFLFSEMVLGRFLRAVSIYIFLLCHLVTIFSTITRNQIYYRDEEAQTGSEKAPALIIDDASEPGVLPPPNGRRSPLSVTASSRLSKLVSRVEPNEALVGVTRTLSNRKASGASITPRRYKRPDLRFDIITPVLSSMPEDPESVGGGPTTGISLTYYTMDIEGPDTVNTPNKEPERTSSPSPYGQLVGKDYSQQTHASGFRPTDRPGFSTTSEEELQHEQDELSKSTAKLGIFPVVTKNELAQETWSIPDSSMSPISDPTPSAKSRRQSTLKTDSVSLHSEFSLSVFPIPPPRQESMPAERRVSRPIYIHRKLSQPATDGSAQRVTPVQESPVDEIAVSSGVNYDVTSFIDTLSRPDGDNTMSEEVTVLSNHDDDAACPGETLSGSVISESINQKQPMVQLKPILLPLVANERDNLPTVIVAPARKASSPSPTVRFHGRDAALRPLLLGTSATSVPVILPSSTMVPLGTRRMSEARRVGKRQISGPRMALAEVEPEAFERPRQPPEYTT